MKEPWKEVKAEDARQLRKEGWVVLFVILAMVGGEISGVVSAIKGASENRHKEERRALVDKLAELPSIEAITKQLDIQKLQLATTEKTVAQLKSEQAQLLEEKRQLASAMKADRDSVEALFTLQQKQNQKTAIRDTIFSFVLGALSSLAATYIWLGIERMRKRN